MSRAAVQNDEDHHRLYGDSVIVERTAVAPVAVAAVAVPPSPDRSTSPAGAVAPPAVVADI